MFLVKQVPGLRKHRRVYRARRTGNAGVTEKRGSIYEFPPLADCRAALEKMIQQGVEWPDQDDWQIEGRESAAMGFFSSPEDLIG
jgi:hypothetical protein